MTVDTFFKICLFAVNKNQNGTLTAEDFNRIANLGQDSFVAYLLGNFQTYQPGRPISKVELGQNSVVRQRLAPVIYGYTLGVNAAGFSPYPADYMQTDSMWGIYGNYNRIRFVDQTKIDPTFHSVIDPIATNPVYMLEDTGFQFEPKTQWQAKLRYVKVPPRIQWGFDLDGNNRRIYSPVNSIDPIWDEATMLDIIVRSLAVIGLNLQMNQVESYANMIKTQGQ